MPNLEVIFRSNNEERDNVSDFSQIMDIPRSNTRNPVTVQVLEVKTSKAIKLLPAFEKQFIIKIESSPTRNFLTEDIDYAFVTVDTTNFNLAQSYDNMFSDCLIPIDFMDAHNWDSLLSDHAAGLEWFQMLYSTVMNKSKYFESELLMNDFRWTVDRFIQDSTQDTDWYKEVRQNIGPLFMASKKEDENTGQQFLKWLWYENYELLSDLDLQVNSNHPVNNQVKVINTTDNHVRFVVPDIRTDHSLFSLFSTLPAIPPHSTTVSQGGQFMPKDPFLNLEVHSNLCKRRSVTGREKSDLLTTVFMGENTEGFMKQEHIQNLPVTMDHGYQRIFFHINASAYRGELLYIHPETASTTIKLRFNW